MAASHMKTRVSLSPDAAGRAPTAHELSVFVRLAETLHFGRAATALGLAQSSLSEAIRRLEAKLDVILVARTSRQVSLTDAGSRLVPVARDILDGLAAARVAARSPAAPATGVLRVGIEGPGLAEMNRPILKVVAARHPAMRVVVKECLGLPQAFFGQRLDVALVRTPFTDRRLLVHPVASEPRGLLVPPHHRLAGGNGVSVREILDEPAVAVAPHAAATRDHWLAGEHRDGRPPLIGGEAFSLQEVVYAVGHLGLVTTGCRSVTRFHPFPEVAFVGAVDLDDEVLAVAVRHDESRSVVLDFVAIVRELVPELVDRSPGGVTAAL